jgi:uncharacterized membrane protein
MLAFGAEFHDYARAVHIIAVVLAFGVPLADPVMQALVERVDRNSVPAFHQVRRLAGRWLVNPAMLLVLIAGIVLASNEHLWKAFFVQWGIGAIVVLGGIEGSFLMPKHGRLGELAERDLAAGGAWSDDYLRLHQRVRFGGLLFAFVVIVTIVIMATHP